MLCPYPLEVAGSSSVWRNSLSALPNNSPRSDRAESESNRSEAQRISEIENSFLYDYTLKSSKEERPEGYNTRTVQYSTG